jgi:tRNA-splicing ligase RtcB
MAQLTILGKHDDETVQQMKNCLQAVPEGEAIGALCADGHRGYSMPIGGVIAYKNHLTPSGVGYDIGCGNLATRINVKVRDLKHDDLMKIADEIAKQIEFGVGGRNSSQIEDAPIFDEIDRSPVKGQRDMLALAKAQLGTVGGGNHYVDILEDENGDAWIGVHFGSRGFGHRTATGFLNLAGGKEFNASRMREDQMAKPTLIEAKSPLGADYLHAMQIAGSYARAGREHVVVKVMEIINCRPLFSVHNHHNFTWQEKHNGEDWWVVRKGATPAKPGQYGFVGGSMGDVSVILKGVEHPMCKPLLYSTVHGAGRVLPRKQALQGKHMWLCPEKGCTLTWIPPKDILPNSMHCPTHDRMLVKTEYISPINYPRVVEGLYKDNIIVRGGGADEAPIVYRKLYDVLDFHSETIEVVHLLKPKIVVMASKDTFDPYKD